MRIFKFGCLFSLSIFILCFIIVGIMTCSNKDWAKDLDTQSRDSLETSTKIDKQKINTDSVMKVFHSDFTIKKDEFSDRVWVEPKNRPHYNNINKIFCYFELKGDKASNFRFRIQYTGDDWLFIDQMIFKINNDRKIVFLPQEMKRDNNSTIWEWCDESIDSKYEFLISAIANAKNVKVKFQGDQYYDVRTLSSEEIKYIKKTYDFYLALGGEF